MVPVQEIFGLHSRDSLRSYSCVERLFVFFSTYFTLLVLVLGPTCRSAYLSERPELMGWAFRNPVQSNSWVGSCFVFFLPFLPYFALFWLNFGPKCHFGLPFGWPTTQCSPPSPLQSMLQDGGGPHLPKHPTLTVWGRGGLAILN